MSNIKFTISVSRIKHKDQRYETVGDWQYDKSGNLNIAISDTKSPKMNALLFIHELIEATLCRENQITQEEVDTWDMTHLETSDPGGVLGCPYYREHMIAEIVEKLMAHELNVDWRVYEKVIENL
jgi:hypothetical protein